MRTPSGDLVRSVLRRAGDRMKPRSFSELDGVKELGNILVDSECETALVG